MSSADRLFGAQGARGGEAGALGPGEGGASLPDDEILYTWSDFE